MVLLPFIAKDLTISLAVVGFLGSAQPLIASLLALPTGFIASRIGGFHLLIMLLIIYSLGALGIAFSPNIWIVILMFFLGAFGFGMFHTVGFALVAKNSEGKNIGRNMGDFTSVGEIGRVAIPPLAVFATSFIGWRFTFIGIACIGLFAYLFFRLFIKPHESYAFKKDPLAKESYKDFRNHIALLFKTKKFLLVTITAIFDSLASSPIYIFLPFFLLAKGLHPIEYGFATATFFVGSLLGKTMLGRGVDKLGNLKVFFVSELAMAGMLFLLPSLFNFFLILIASLLLGVFTKGTSPVVQTLFSQMTEKEHYNKVFAISELTIGLAAVVAQIALGFIAEAFDISLVFYICGSLAVFAIFPCLLLAKQKAP